MVELERARVFKSSNAVVERVKHVLVRVARVSEPSLAGWGECATLSEPGYSPETTDLAWQHLNRVFAPGIASHCPDDPGEVGRYLLSLHEAAELGEPGLTSFSRAAVEWAIWDLWARRREVSLARALSDRYCGGRIPSSSVPAGATLGEPGADWADEIEWIRSAGISRIKVKASPDTPLKFLQNAKSTLPGVYVTVDANESFDPENPDHIRWIEGFAEMGGSAIEQPFDRDDLVAHAMLAKRIVQLEVVLDESVSSLSQAKLAIDAGAMNVLCVKPGRLGGIEASADVMRLCRDSGIGMYLGGMHEFGVGRYGLLAMGAMGCFDRVGDLGPSIRYFADDLVEPPLEIAASEKPGKGSGSPEVASFTVPESPGLGCVPNEAAINDSSSQRATYSG